MNAADLRVRANNANEALITTQLELLHILMADAADAGKYSIRVDDTTLAGVLALPEVQHDLISAGYAVTRYEVTPARPTETFVISW